jgi:hypothetical protein
LGGALGLLLSLVGCARDDAPSPAAAPPESLAKAQAPTIEQQAPVRPARPRMMRTPDQFRKDMAHRFDASRVTVHHLPEGGDLFLPNGWAPHTMMMVKNPDGTFSKRCVSSYEEAEDLVNQISAGGSP